MEGKRKGEFSRASKPVGKSWEVKDMVVAALMAAVIFVVTFTVRIPIPYTSGGYINIGDAMIFLAAWLIGASKPGIRTAVAAAMAAATGSALADLAVGAALYIVPTFVIKGVMGFAARLMILKRRSFPLFISAAAVCGAIMVSGYFIFDYCVMGVQYALASAAFNCFQWIGNVAAAAVLFPAVKRVEERI